MTVNILVTGLICLIVFKIKVFWLLQFGLNRGQQTSVYHTRNTANIKMIGPLQNFWFSCLESSLDETLAIMAVNS